MKTGCSGLAENKARAGAALSQAGVYRYAIRFSRI